MNKIPDLAISAAKVAAIIAKARQFDVKDVVTDPNSSSNASDEAMLAVLEDHADDPVRTLLTATVRGLNEDEQIDLVTLVWLGRGDGGIDDWDDLRARAVEARAEYRSARRETVRYLLGEPMLGDLLADGLDAFGVDWSEQRLTADSSDPSERDEDEPTKQR